jgi:hypothetical protein
MDSALNCAFLTETVFHINCIIYLKHGILSSTSFLIIAVSALVRYKNCIYRNLNKSKIGQKSVTVANLKK